MAVLSLKEHIPSHMTIASNKVLISYEGQSPNCYGCNGTSPISGLSKPQASETHPTHNAHDFVGWHSCWGTSSIRLKTRKLANNATQDNCSDGQKEESNIPIPGKGRSQALEKPGTTQTQMSPTSKDNKDAVQADEQPESMIMSTDGPFNSTQDTQAVCETKETTTIPPYVLNTETDISDEGTERQQNTNNGTTRYGQGVCPHPRWWTTTISPND